MTTPAAVIDLVERFSKHLSSYKRTAYNETQVRQEFIDPLFEALGWDVYNKQGRAEAYKDVVFEDTVKVGGATKAPDYGFRIGGARKFFVEAKKPSVNIKDEPHPAYQLRRYAWSAKLPLSILTDFEELAVYDCRQKPEQHDKPSTARVKVLTFDQYPEQWDYLAGIFSREAIVTGAFDAYAASNAGKRGTSEVDRVFLGEIERWRELLARNIALRNPQVGRRDLNFAVQRIIDRIIFLRIAEDRGVEPYGRLQGLQNGNQVHERLGRLFQMADQRYNSGLFHFQPEKGRSDDDLDTFTPGLLLDDRVLKDIFKNLYYPDSPYEFSVLPADILGQIYEQFLGKVIRLTAGHQAKVEEKPEVKKAGGVYYTPTYIVDYIVKHTLGKLLEGKQPGPQGAVSFLRVLDPACGSGSFLLGAYQYLLNWHLVAYTEDVKRWAGGKSPRIYQADHGEWRLTTDERKRILLNNIYGVDIDPQAVEVTKLSLLLKVLEGETEHSLATQLSFLQQRVLPDLAGNIKCGNSLIGTDFHQRQLALLDAEEEYRINAFDWQAEFPEIIKAGGFDAVIGNPPYVRQETLGDQKAYFESHFRAYHGMADLYVYFIERGISLLKPGGLFSYIVANKWMRANYGLPLRRWLKGQHIEEIVDFGDVPVFKTATTYPCILRVRRDGAGDSFEAVVVDGPVPTDLAAYVEAHRFAVSQATLEDRGWSLVRQDSVDLLTKMAAKGPKLTEYVGGRIYYGIKTGLNEAFVIDRETRDRLIAESPTSAEIIRPFLAGRDVKRYEVPRGDRYLLFTRRGIDIKRYPAIRRHLEQFKPSLMPRPKTWKGDWPGRKPGSYQWYEVQDTIDYFAEFDKPKIVVPAIVQRASYAFDAQGYCSNDKTTIIVTADMYLLGLLNSKTLDYVMHAISSTKRGGYFEYKPMYLVQLPIRTIDFTNPADVARHDQMVALVERMLALHKQEAHTPHDKALLKRQIETTDREIDRLVYELYDLTAEEIAIVEGA